MVLRTLIASALIAAALALPIRAIAHPPQAAGIRGTSTSLGGAQWVEFEDRTDCVRTQSALARLVTYVIEPAGFLMTRRMLLGVKQRAEALKAARTDGSRANRQAA